MMSFQELTLIPDIKKRLKELEFDKLFPIQEEAIMPLLQGHDVIGQAKTGTGKTAAYAIPIIEKLRPRGGVQALIIVPTRELAQQVEQQFKDIAKYIPLRFLAVFGGAPIGRQIEKLSTADVVIGTPGRLIDHLSRGTLRLEKTKILVIDEADRMLDMGFIDDVRFITSHLSKDRQTCMFSATMQKEVIRLAETTMKDPVKILVDADEISVEGIEQLYCMVERRFKLQTLYELLRQFKWSKILVFVSTRRQADWLADRLDSVITAQKLHGGLPQSRRNEVLRRFREDERSMIVATDLAARGIDIPSINCVINYDMPRDPLTYFHRIGRTGRAGGQGTAISIVSYEDGPALAAVKSITKVQFRELARESTKYQRSNPWSNRTVDQPPLIESVF